MDNPLWFVGIEAGGMTTLIAPANAETAGFGGHRHDPSIFNHTL